MAINFDNAFGIHEQALEIRSKRAEVLADNMANVETPGFLARDVDFAMALKSRMNEQQIGFDMARTQANHINKELKHSMHPDVMYRIPYESSIDGNTVDEHREKANFSKNTLDFQASFRFLNSRIKGLLTAIKGEL